MAKFNGFDYNNDKSITVEELKRNYREHQAKRAARIAARRARIAARRASRGGKEEEEDEDNFISLFEPEVTEEQNEEPKEVEIEEKVQFSEEEEKAAIKISTEAGVAELKRHSSSSRGRSRGRRTSYRRPRTSYRSYQPRRTVIKVRGNGRYGGYGYGGRTYVYNGGYTGARRTIIVKNRMPHLGTRTVIVGGATWGYLGNYYGPMTYISSCSNYLNAAI